MRSFAVIPAAGRSQRMGQAKLLLPWGGGTLIEHVLRAWRASAVEQIVAVVHPQDAQLAEVCRAGGAQVVQPDVPPAEMKESVLRALEFIARDHNPGPVDSWLLSPADIPGIEPETIDALIAAHRQSGEAAAGRASIWVPRSAGRRGHPVLFDWSLAAEIAGLGADEGVSALLRRHAVGYIERAAAVPLDDVDTPADYARLRPKPGP